ncbi:MAG: fibronectin type III domain-containing protein [Elusimicrobiota bacterium]
MKNILVLILLLFNISYPGLMMTPLFAATENTGEPVFTLSGLAKLENLQVKSLDNIKLTWSPPTTEPLNYFVYRSTSILGPWINLTKKPVKTTKFTDYFYKENRLYYYRVQAINKEDVAFALSDPSAAKISTFKSGLSYMSTAYREKTPTRGLNVDFLFSYYIGRIFGETRNQFSDFLEPQLFAPSGLLLLNTDIKMVMETERTFWFNWAIGYRYTYIFTSPRGSSTVAFRIGEQSDVTASGYVAVSKQIGYNWIHLGLSKGNEDKIFPLLSEFLKTRTDWVHRDLALYAGFETRQIPWVRFRVEGVHPLDHPLQPWLIYTNLGQLFGISFEFAYLNYFDGYGTSYEIFGFFSYRFTFFPQVK